MSDYKDIISFNYEMKHKRMSLYNRAAQFASFAALNGYSDIIKVSSKKVDAKKIIDDDLKDILDEKIKSMIDHKVKVTYFVKDMDKEGGSYILINDILKRIDYNYKYIELESKKKILIDDIYDIDWYC